MGCFSRMSQGQTTAMHQMGAAIMRRKHRQNGCCDGADDHSYQVAYAGASLRV